MLRKVAILAILAISQIEFATATFAQGEYLSGIKWPEPPIIKPGKTDADPPSDAIVLFDGKDLSAWENGDKWIVKDGVAIVKGTDITSKQKFGDCQLHVEWSSPVPAKGTDQGRGNSGVFLMDHYELQVLDSYDNVTYYDGQASAIYKQMPPMVNVMRKPGEWNTYDIVWTAPQFKEDGSLESPAYITVLHNGVLTVNHFALEGSTLYNELPHYEKHGKMPIHLQNHGNPVKYRNIWVREIKPIEGVRERQPYFYNHDTKKEIPATNGGTATGNVNVNGKPLNFGQIYLHLQEGSDVYSSRVRNGKYDIRHVPPGKYSVTIEAKEDAGEKVNVPEKYSNPKQSELRAEIRDGANEMEFDLKK